MPACERTGETALVSIAFRTQQISTLLQAAMMLHWSSYGSSAFSLVLLSRYSIHTDISAVFIIISGSLVPLFVCLKRATVLGAATQCARRGVAYSLWCASCISAR